MPLIIAIIVIIIIVKVISKRKYEELEKEILQKLGFSSWNMVTYFDEYVAVKSRQALEKYDDVKFFKENKGKLTRAEVQHEKKTSSEQQTEKIKSITEPHKDVKKTEPVKKEHVKEVIKREEKLSEVQENTKEACEKFLHDVLKTMGMEVEITI